MTNTTDFGLADEYVGVMKGVILSRLPTARIVDLTHQIPPQDLRRTAYLIEAARPYFPAGTLHVLVVDPGVGTSRRLILVAAAGQLFLAPDNGILTLPIRAGFETAYEVECCELFLEPGSTTFHGRDILAPVAAELAKGLAPAAVGRPLSREELVSLPLASVVIDPAGTGVAGEVVSIDHFGNLLTNIPCDALRQAGGPPPFSEIVIRIGETMIAGVASSYGTVAPGELLALFGSRGLLEISVNQGSAARELVVGPGEPVSVLIGGRS
ncbi:MAG: SAM-dependent chlorinase/fluorinase [Deltaproteobacteria bacterium]